MTENLHITVKVKFWSQERINGSNGLLEVEMPRKTLDEWILTNSSILRSLLWQTLKEFDAIDAVAEDD